MNWENLKEMRCPRCKGKVEDNHRMGYECQTDDCHFFVGYEKFQKLINDMMTPKKSLYDPDKIDRSSWQ